MSLKSKIVAKIKKWLSKTFGVSDAPKPPSTPQTHPSDAPAPSVDALPWETIHWYGQNNASKAIQTKVLRSATISGDMNVSLDYDTNADWPAVCKVVSDCHSSFLVFTTSVNGTLQGGHSDHMRINAKIRDLGNFYSGYLISGVPRNQDIYIAIASHDGKQRSNLVKAIRK